MLLLQTRPKTPLSSPSSVRRSIAQFPALERSPKLIRASSTPNFTPPCSCRSLLGWASLPPRSSPSAILHPSLALCVTPVSSLTPPSARARFTSTSSHHCRSTSSRHHCSISSHCRHRLPEPRCRYQKSHKGHRVPFFGNSRCRRGPHRR